MDAHPADLPVLDAQLGVWLAEQAAPGAASPYLWGEYTDIRGDLDVDLLTDAVRRAVAGADALAVVFAEGGDGGVRQRATRYTGSLPVIDLRDEPDPHAAAVARMRARLAEPVDLRVDPLHGAVVLRVADDRHLLFQWVHHIVLDGFGMTLLSRRIAETYSRLVAGEPVPAAPDGGLRALVAEEREYQDSPAMVEDREWWLHHMGDRPDALSLAAHPAGASASSLRVTSGLTEAEFTRLARAADRSQTRWSRLVLACAALHLHAVTGSRDVTVSLPVSGRASDLSRAIPAMTANVLPLRLRVDPADTVAGFVAHVHEEVRAVQQHQRYRGERLRRDLGALADGRKFFGPVVNIQRFDYHLRFGQCRATVHNVQAPPSEDLSIVAYDYGDGALRLDFDGNPANHDTTLLGTVRDRFLHVLRALADAEPTTRLGRLHATTPDERDQVRALGTARPSRTTGSVTARFAEQCARTPDAVAVRCASTGHVLTYRELDIRAQAVAARLVEAGVVGESPVGLLLDRSPDLVAAVLGVLKAGAAYVPLYRDDALPRMMATIARAGIKTLLVAAETPTWFSAQGGTVIDLHSIPDSAMHPDARTHPDQLACVMFTSGSTGVPKGVAVTHDAIVRLAGDRAWDDGAAERFLLHSPHAFDASTLELWVPLLTGGQVVIAPPGEFDLAVLADTIARTSVTGLWLTAGLFAAVAAECPEALRGVRQVWTGGDVVQPEAVRKVQAVPGAPVVVNGYGPTETTVFATRHTVRDHRSVPIGVPLDGTRVYVLDDALRPVPPGAVGELYVAGAGLARGYLGDPAETAHRFVADISGPPGARMYRTGDLARWNPQGLLEFVGRADGQVKLRGFRVETGEIDSALLGLPGVTGAATVVSEARLVSYVTGDAADTHKLRDQLARRLPAFMVPDEVIALDRLPLTRNGKVDRLALPTPGADQGTTPKVKPASSVEQVLAGLFAEVLGRADVPVDGDFFRIGGDSIKAIQLAGRARKAGLVISTADIFRAPTVRELAAGLSVPATVRLPHITDDSDGVVPLTPIMHWLRGLGGGLTGFSQSVELRTPPGLTEAELGASLDLLAAHHDMLRMRVSIQDGYWEIDTQGEPTIPLERHDVATLPDEHLRTLINEHATRARAELDPATGNVAKAIWFDAGEGTRGTLVLAVHHLAVDGVSWRILAEDLRDAWADNTSPLAPVGTSFAHWATALARYAQHRSVRAHFRAWRDTLTAVDPPWSDRPRSPRRDTEATRRAHTVMLPADLAVGLVGPATDVNACSVNDVLLTALALAAADRRASGGTAVLLDLEGHGREEFADGLDTTRTVGWFTTMFPVILDPGSRLTDIDRDPALLDSALQRVRATVEAIPDNGIGYGLLRYLDPQSAVALAAAPTPQLGFNYLGRFTANDDQDFVLGSSMPTGTALAHTIELTTLITDHDDGPRLAATWSWAGELLPEADIVALAERWTHALSALVARARERAVDVVPLPPLAQGLLFHSLYDHDGADPYLVRFVFDLAGPLDAGRLREAVHLLLRRHPNLSAAIENDPSGRPVQRIPLNPVVEWTDHASDVDVERYLERDRLRRFDLANPPLVRCALLRKEPDRHVFVLTTHHILVDGWSMPVLIRELFTLYGGGDLPPAPQYRTFLTWLSTRDTLASEAVWRELLSGVDEPTLVAGRGGTGTTATRGQVVLDIDAGERLHRAAREHGVTASTLVRFAWACVLGALTGRDDVVFGATVSGRPPELPGVEDIVGLLINTLPVRCRLDPGSTIADALAALHHQQLSTLDHQHVDLTRVQAIAGRGELFDTVVVFENYPLDPTELRECAPGLEITDIRGLDGTHYPLALVVMPGETLRLRLDHRHDVLDGTEARRLLDRLAAVLDRITTAPQARLADLDLLLPDEHPAPPAAEDPPGPALTDLFAAQVAERPDATALTHDGEHLTYRELDRRANRIAHQVLAAAPRGDALVAIALTPSFDLIAAILGVLKAGAAYLPLDPEHPPERRRRTIAAARPALVITADTIDRLQPDTDPGVPVDSRATAYVIHTSGSTGAPKGVVVTHHNVVRLLSTTDRHFGFGPDDVHVLFHSHAFDVSVWEMWAALGRGGRLVLLPRAVARSPRDLLDLLADEGVTALSQTPSAFYQLIAAEAEHPVQLSLRYVVLAGEALDLARVRSWHGPGRPLLVNMYGITETTVHSSHHELRDPDETRGVVGTALDDLRIHLLDHALRPVPPGGPGEIHVAGPGVTSGYLNAPALTATRFVADPWGPPGSRMYRSGDLARRLPDGTLEYLGRVDQQVKVRGFRIEPAEVERALEEHPSVARAVVVPRLEAGQLVAYTVLTAPVEPAALRSHVSTLLPAHMVPAFIVPVDAIPLTHNGKLDRAALPAPESAVAAGRPPATESERLVCEVFTDVLGVARVGADDSFFDLGGHSLLATRVINVLRARIGVELAIRTLFDAPTPAALALRLTGRTARPGPRPGPRPDRIPLSPAQQRLWFYSRFTDNSPTYNMAFAVRLTGPLAVPALRAAVRDVVVRHEVLRTVIHEDGGEAHQVVRADVEVPFEVVPTTETELPARLASAAAHRFDLSAEPPVRVTLLPTGPERHVLLILLHHIAADGWSLAPLARDLSTAYTARRNDESPAWPAPAVQYADFTLWRRDTDAELDHWLRVLRGAPDTLPLPTDRPRPEVSAHRGETVDFEIDADLHTALDELARARGASVFMVLHAALAVLLHRLGGGEDIPIGTPVAGRHDHTLDDAVGCFVNTIVLRTDVSGTPTFTELLDRVRSVDLTAFAHQQVPFERLVEVLNPPRSLSRHPVFQVMLAFQDTPSATFDLPGLVTEPVSLHGGASRLDLLWSARQRRAADGTPTGIEAILEYDTELFTPATARALITRFIRVLRAAVATPDAPVADLPILAEDERRRLLTRWNDTHHSVPDTGIPDMFADWVAQTPTATAVIDGDAALTYESLADRVRDIARDLAECGAGPGDLVALRLPRGAELIAAVLAVLRVGAAYLPVETDLPPARAELILADARPALVLDSGGVSRRNGEPVRLPAGTAYAIYTSGSTGTPKGVVVPRAAVMNLLLSLRDRLGLAAGDRVLTSAPAGFDMSVPELLLAPISGGTVVLADADAVRDPESLLDLIRRHRVTMAQATPSLWRTVVAHPAADTLRGLRVVVGGEAVPGGIADALTDLGCSVLACYGPTETTVWSTSHPIRATSPSTVPLGRPLWNTQCYVLDRRLRPVPPGVAGELHIAGAGVATGYLGQPALTAQRFVPDPFGPPGTRMYRTGDLASWDDHGDLRFHGREDDQIKLRGHRIEFGEVEAVLAEHPAVTAAAVAVHDRGGEDRRLVAYAVGDLDTADVLAHLARRLPAYMVPSRLVVLDRLPLGVNGKLHRDALPEPDWARTREVVAPRTLREHLLCRLFAEVLGLPSVGATDNFFELGGHSLLVARLTERVQTVLGLSARTRDVFAAGTPAALATLLGDPDEPNRQFVPFRTGGDAGPVICVHPLAGISWLYAGLLPSIDKAHPVYGLDAADPATMTDPPGSIEDMAARYADDLLSALPNGPYHLVGWSFGGLLAHAIAVRLREAGADVGVVFLVDPPARTEDDLVSGIDDRRVYRVLLTAVGHLDDELPVERMTFPELTAILRQEGSVLATFTEDDIARVVAMSRLHAGLMPGHRPGRYDGDVVYVATTGGAPDAEPDLAEWRAAVGGELTTHVVACHHHRAMQPQHVGTVGALLRHSLDRHRSEAQR